MFVEAHTVGQDDWTTLPDLNGHTSAGHRRRLPGPDPFWLDENPFLNHYITRTASTGAASSAPRTGRPGDWNAATGNSAGFQDWNVDLSAVRRQAGRGVDHAT